MQELVDISMEVFEGEVIPLYIFRMMLNWIILKEKMRLYRELLYNSYIFHIVKRKDYSKI